VETTWEPPKTVTSTLTTGATQSEASQPCRWCGKPIAQVSTSETMVGLQRCEASDAERQSNTTLAYNEAVAPQRQTRRDLNSVHGLSCVRDSIDVFRLPHGRCDVTSVDAFPSSSMTLQVPPNSQHQPRTRQAANLRMQI